MFGIFKKKTELEKLELRHKKCLEEAFSLSKMTTAASDAKMAEAAEIQMLIDETIKKIL